MYFSLSWTILFDIVPNMWHNLAALIHNEPKSMFWSGWSSFSEHTLSHIILCNPMHDSRLMVLYKLVSKKLASFCYLHLLPLFLLMQLLQQLKRLICDLCRLYNLPQHPDVEMLDQPLPAGPISQDKKVAQISTDLHTVVLLHSFLFLFPVWADASFLSLFFPAWNNRWSDIRRRGGRRNGRGIKL